MNARMRELAPGILAERVANSVHIGYDPVTSEAEITYSAPEYLVLDERVHALAGAPDLLRVAMEGLRTRRFGIGLTDPVTGASLDGVSGAGQELLMKVAFDTLFNERAAARANGEG